MLVASMSVYQTIESKMLTDMHLLCCRALQLSPHGLQYQLEARFQPCITLTEKFTFRKFVQPICLVRQIHKE